MSHFLPISAILLSITYFAHWHSIFEGMSKGLVVWVQYNEMSMEPDALALMTTALSSNSNSVSIKSQMAFPANALLLESTVVVDVLILACIYIQ